MADGRDGNSADPDGPAPDAGPGSACSQTSLFADDFNDGVRGPYWDDGAQSGAAMISESAGRAVVSLPSAANAIAEWRSLARYDFTGSRVYVEVPRVLNPAATQAFATIGVFDGFQNRLTLRYEGGRLSFRAAIAGNLTILGSVPHDPVGHRWWQLREAAGTVYFETSPDGVNWATRAQDATPAWSTTAEIRIGGGTNAAGPNPGEAHFDNLNGGTPSGTWCPASRLNDDFGDGALARMWAGSYSAGGATLQETGGEAVLTPPPGVPSSSVGLVGAYGYDLTGDAIAFEVTEMLTPERGAAAFVEVSAGLGNALRIQKVGSELAYMQGAGGVFTPRKSEPFDPVRHRWWRIRESAGTTYWETSADGRTWVAGSSATNFISLRPVAIGIFANTFSPVASPGRLRIDNVNRTP